MRRNKITIIALSAIILSAISCKDDDLSTGDNPFDLTTESNHQVRNKIVVISDLHLGADTSYSECVKHLPRLTQFLTEIRESKTVKELVIAGDMLDEWYVPSRTNTFGGGTENTFIQKIATTNKCVFDVLNAIIEDGNIKVSYTPGNHDLLVEKENVEAILPGINQARDTGKLGLGTYHPDGYPQIAIEHGHRYDFFCAPDPYSNQDIAPGSILPPGYFFTRIAVNSITNPPTAVGDTTQVRTVTLNSTDATQVNNYYYYKTWQNVLTSYIPVKDNFDDKIIVTNIGNYTSNYSVNDIIPYNNPDGTIDMTLFSGACNQQTWEKRLAYNNVPVMTSVTKAIPGSLDHTYIDGQANTQYFQNDSSKVRIVVFGHTHVPLLGTYTNAKKGECVYANSGTWIDKKVKNGATVDQDIQNMDFIVIMPQAVDTSMMKVEHFKYENGKQISIESKSIKL
ncbi:MAG: metallophosphoesterase [Bacteroidales bacterium]|nr:metallophosphoesterase [Bacteroidales bacterium]